MTGRLKVLLVAVEVLFSCVIYGQHKQAFPLIIQFQNGVGEVPLNFDSTYTNVYGETFTVRNFRYYISHLSVTDTKGKSYSLPEKYFLIDERKPESKTIIVAVPFPVIKAITFRIGVDSIKNISGVQTGVLDPANGMFWAWNSGYIYAKLEGTSPQAKAPQNGFTYHIGGFRTGENAQRKVALELREPFRKVVNQKVFIKVDVNAWFNGTHPFKISDLPSIMTPGTQAMLVADNYSRMFSITTNQ